MCGRLINDDVGGITAVAYEKVLEGLGRPSPNISAMVQDAVRHAARLPRLSDAQRQQDYDRVHEPWECLGMRKVPAADLEGTLVRIIRGYFAEGTADFKVEILEQQVAMLSFVSERGWRPVRFSRARDGSYFFYGQVCLYRFLAGGNGAPEAKSSPSAAAKGRAEVLDTTLPVFRLKAGMGKEAVIGLLGDRYRATTAREFYLNPARTTPGMVEVIDASILEDEYWLYSGRGRHVEITFRSGALLSAVFKRVEPSGAETVLARIDYEGMAVAEPYRAVLGANQL